jgi:hypothetical protein
MGDKRPPAHTEQCAQHEERAGGRFWHRAGIKIGARNCCLFVEVPGWQCSGLRTIASPIKTVVPIRIPFIRVEPRQGILNNPPDAIMRLLQKMSPVCHMNVTGSSQSN